MSEAELQKYLTENEKLAQTVEFTKSIIKVSEACEQLVDYMNKTQDALIPSKAPAEGNYWAEKGKGGPCLLL